MKADVERIIERASYAEDKGRVAKWLRAKYPHLTEADIKYICKRSKFKDFGRLSRTFLTGIEGTCKETGEVATVISMMWESNDNLMELLSERYTFADTILEFKSDYYTEKKKTATIAVKDQMHQRALAYASNTRYLILVDTTANRVGIYSGSVGKWNEVKKVGLYYRSKINSDSERNIYCTREKEKSLDRDIHAGIIHSSTRLSLPFCYL